MSSQPLPRIKSVKDWFWRVFCGMCMGAADVVPGISGGTMAFVMGFFEDLIFSIKSITPSTIFKPSKVAWGFLLTILFGIVLSMATLSQVVQLILGDEVYRVYLYAAFMGLILASIVFCGKQMDVWHLKYITALGIGIVIAFLFTGFVQMKLISEETYNVEVDGIEKGQIANYDAETEELLGVTESELAAMLAKGYIDKDTKAYNINENLNGDVGEFVQPKPHHFLDLWIITGGFIGICALLLPGISGSYLLMILGMYAIVIGALADFVTGLRLFTFNYDAFAILFNMAIGITLGALFFSRIVSYLLTRYHQATIATLIGFMIGSLPVVWPFWSYEYRIIPLQFTKGPILHTVSPILPEINLHFWIALTITLFGFILVFLLETLATHVACSVPEQNKK